MRLSHSGDADMEGYINLKTLTLDELIGVVNLYPWFGNARKELCVRLAAMGDAETASAALAEASLYVSSGKSLSGIGKKGRLSDCSDKDLDDILKSYISGKPETVRDSAGSRPVVVVGGDYFSQDEYDRIRKSGDEVFSDMARKASADSRREVQPADGTLEFYTETLAGIYAEQGYPEQAKRIYEKLILAYPEKNAYFAALIQKLGLEN